MNRRMKFRSLVILLLLLAKCTIALAQVVVERSKDKVVIAGITYYIHVVKKGETLYSISKAYGISTEELIKENPLSAGGLNEGQSLRINAYLVSSEPPSPPAPLPVRQRDESKFIYHALQPGETIYYLSKTYSVSENEIVQSNPGIDIYKLPLGYEVAVPRKEFMNEKRSFSNREAQGYYHKVIRGETLSSIARQYGVSVRDLRRENRDIRFPQVGDYLKIPGMKPPPPKLPVEVAGDSVLIEQEDQVVYLERPSDYTSVTNLHGTFDVAVMLPFYLAENARRIEIDSSKSVKGEKLYRVINRPDDWIYPRSLGFVEMYEGILLAADTLSALGLNINIQVYDITDDTAKLSRLIRSGRLDHMDLIIGPVYSGNLSMVTSHAGTLGIPVISPVQLSNNSVLENNPMLYMASSSLEVAQKAIARKMKDYSDSNIIIIHSDSETGDHEVGILRNMIVRELYSIMPFEEIRLKDMVFYSRSVFGNDSINRLAHAMTNNTGNVVIIASENPPVMSETLTDVHALSRKYNLSVFGYPSMRYLDNFDHRICFDLGLMIYSPYWINYRQKDIIEFNNDYRAKLLTEPSEMSYAWQGYDILYYFLSGLAIHGKEFLTHPEIHKPDLLHTEFDFRRSSGNDGFENQNLFLIRYSNNYELELLDDPVVDSQTGHEE